MDTPLTLSAAFILGLFSTLHCVGMCGGIVGALSLSLPNQIKSNRLRLSLYLIALNTGRIMSYMLAGLIAGSVGAQIMTVFNNGHTILQASGVAMMIAMGLYIAGWLPQLTLIEKLGIPIWKKLEPVSRRFLPISNLPQALAYGLIWGWLPCGMVYFVVLWTLNSGSAWQGALTMLSFGAGTFSTLR